MLDYIYHKLQQFWEYIVPSLLLSPAWAHFTSGANDFFTSKAVIVIVSLWFLDILAKWIYLLVTPGEKICLQKSQSCWINLAIWGVWLLVAYGFRYFGASLVAYPIELAMVLIQGGSVIKNICQCSSSPFLRTIGEKFEDAMEAKVMDSFDSSHFIIHTLTSPLEGHELAKSNTFNPYPRVKYNMEVKDNHGQA